MRKGDLRVIRELNVPSYRLEKAKKQADKPNGKATYSDKASPTTVDREF